ncbi:hypothetical protein, partial [Priestia megaterium]|uniref:hypothetical protein n=1 Tax=Priestia megaterium TaxID=1404 RepID=UPI001649B606
RWEAVDGIGLRGVLLHGFGGLNDEDVVFEVSIVEFGVIVDLGWFLSVVFEELAEGVLDVSVEREVSGLSGEEET